MMTREQAWLHVSKLKTFTFGLCFEVTILTLAGHISHSIRDEMIADIDAVWEYENAYIWPCHNKAYFPKRRHIAKLLATKQYDKAKEYISKNREV